MTTTKPVTSGNHKQANISGEQTNTNELVRGVPGEHKRTHPLRGVRMFATLFARNGLRKAILRCGSSPSRAHRHRRPIKSSAASTAASDDGHRRCADIVPHHPADLS